MKGLSNLLDRVNGKTGPERVRPADVDVEMDDELEDPPYEVRMRRPVLDFALRAGLWAAVGFGCLGGLLAMVGLTGREGDTVIQEAPPGGDVPAPVARVAERAVEVWLTAESEDDPLLTTLFVERPTLHPSGPDEQRIAVGRVTTVGGGLWEENYWLVTAAVEVAECVPDDSPGWVSDAGTEDGTEEDGPVASETDSSPLAASLSCDPGASEGEGTDGTSTGDDDGADEAAGENYDGIGPDGTYQGDDASAEESAEDSADDETADEVAAGPSTARSTTLFVQVGVVGELEERVAALSTPSVVAAPDAVSPDWESTGRDAEAPSGDEPAARVVEGFLDGWLVGGGDDPSLYAAAGLDVSAVEPAPFSDLVLTEISYLQEETGATDVRAFVDATTPGGTTVTAAYELSLAFREDRWEVTGYWGAPSLIGRPADGTDGSGAPEAGGDQAGTDVGGGEGGGEGSDAAE